MSQNIVMTEKNSQDNLLEKSDADTMIQSRFGEISVNSSKAVFFPKGIYGFPENLHFAIANFPQQNLSQFKILQCLNDHSVSIPVLPSSYENDIIDNKDMEECIKSIEVQEEDFAMLFIVSSEKNRETGLFDLSLNAKAPIVMDTKVQTAIQYIFTNNKYSIKHKISE